MSNDIKKIRNVLTSRKHMYEEQECEFLKTCELPRYSDNVMMDALREAFIMKFPDNLPTPSPKALYIKSKQLRGEYNTKKLSEKKTEAVKLPIKRGFSKEHDALLLEKYSALKGQKQFLQKLYSEFIGNFGEIKSFNSVRTRAQTLYRMSRDKKTSASANEEWEVRINKRSVWRGEFRPSVELRRCKFVKVIKVVNKF